MRAPRRRLRLTRQAQSQPLSCDRDRLQTLPSFVSNFIWTTLYTELPDTHPRGVRLFTCQRAKNRKIYLHTSTITFVIAGVNFLPGRKTSLRQGRRDGSDHSVLVNSLPHTKQAANFSFLHTTEMRSRDGQKPTDAIRKNESRQEGTLSENSDGALSGQAKFACQLDSPALPKECCKPQCATQIVSNRCSSVTAADPGRW